MGAQALNAIGGPSPWINLAITAIEANERSSQVRGVSVKSQLQSSWASLDPKAKAQMSKATRDVVAMAGKSMKETAVEDMAGVTGPLGFWDPLGFATDCPSGKLAFYREVELKHGRVGMLASLGFLVGEQFHPLFGGDIDVPAYLAFQQTPLETFWPAVVFAIAIPEIFSVFTFNNPYGEKIEGDFGWSIRDDHEAGDLGFDPLGLKPTDPEEFKEMQTKEINNGRLAMIAAAGMIAQELATGQKLF